MRYFFDNCMSIRLARAFAELGEDVVHHKKAGFPEGCDDEVWMPQVAANGWVAVSGDKRLFSQERVRRVRESVRLKTVVMPKGYPEWVFWQQVEFLVKAWQRIRHEGDHAKDGDFFFVNANGKVAKYVPAK